MNHALNTPLLYIYTEYRTEYCIFSRRCAPQKNGGGRTGPVRGGPGRERRETALGGRKHMHKHTRGSRSRGVRKMRTALHRLTVNLAPP